MILSHVPKRRPVGPISRTTSDGAVQPTEKAATAPHGRGASGGSAGSARIDNPDRRTGQLPIWTDGDPSSSPDVTASRMMQNVMGDDDKEWYAELNRKQVKDFLKPRNTVGHGFDVGLNCARILDGDILEHGMKCLGCATGLCERHIVESKKRKKKKGVIAEPDSSGKGKPKKDEVNAAASGNVAGYQLPLGMSNQSRKKRRRGSTIAAHSFGGGNFVD